MILLRKLLNLLLSYSNKKLEKELLKIVKNFKLLDLGAAGDLDNRWKLLNSKIIQIYAAEPHPSSFKNLKKKNILINKLFHNNENKKEKLYLTKKPECSSIYRPNFEHLKNFKDADRYNILDEVIFDTTCIDTEFKNTNLDFVKIDTQGSEFEILNGAKEKMQNILGLEIECCFFQIYKEQKLFENIKDKLRENDFEFIDFLDLIRWEKNRFSKLGQPQFSNVLFLKKIDKVLEIYQNKNMDHNIINNYIAILSVYNRSDLLIELNDKILKYKNKQNLDKIIKLVSKRAESINRVEHYSSVLKGMLNRS